MITKKLSCRTAISHALILVMLLFAVSCKEKSDSAAERTSNESPQNEVRDSSSNNDDKVSSQGAAAADGALLPSPIYVGSEKFKQAFEKKFADKYHAMAQRYGREDMIDMTVPYVRRVVRGDHRRAGNSNRPTKPEHIDCRTESILLYLDKDDLISILNDNPSTTGLIAIFATEMQGNSGRPKNQTMILVPFDLTEPTALATASSSGVQGYERWPTDPRPTDPQRVDLTLQRMYAIDTARVRAEVGNVYTALGIR